MAVAEDWDADADESIVQMSYCTGKGKIMLFHTVLRALLPINLWSWESMRCGDKYRTGLILRCKYCTSWQCVNNKHCPTFGKFVYLMHTRGRIKNLNPNKKQGSVLYFTLGMVIIFLFATKCIESPLKQINNFRLILFSLSTVHL